MELLRARRIADELLRGIRPHCHRAEVAGSVRRGKREVGDIEIICIPKYETVPTGNDLFREEEKRNNLLFDHWATSVPFTWIKPNTDRIAPWQISPDGKYWRGLLPEGVKLDLWIAKRENWGFLFTVRTGPKDFSKKLVTFSALRGYPCKDGYVWCAGDRLVISEEDQMFRLLDLEWIAPEDRDDQEAVAGAGLILPEQRSRVS